MMKELDCVRITAEKPRYAEEGVHQGMYGWICLDDGSNGYWLVNIPQCGENPDIATLAVHENDMEVVPIMYAAENERIKAEWGD